MDKLDYKTKEITIDDISDNDVEQFRMVINEMVRSYSDKDLMLSDEDWLATEYKKRLTELSEFEAKQMAIETIEFISNYDENFSSINFACSKGITKEKWLADKIASASIGTSVVDYGNYLFNIDNAISTANAQMLRSVTTNSGEISKCFNLDGFIAEQFHVNDFNMKSALAKSKYVAEVCVPEAGQTYGLNSFDSVIRESSSGKIVHQYQFKYGADSKSTIRLIQDGNYNNQRIVVPFEQVDEVRKAFPGKSIEAFIGGTEKCSIQSTALSKQQVKDIQLKAQRENYIRSETWNSFNTKELALNLGKQAGITGIQAATITTGLTMAINVMSGDQNDIDKIIEKALKTGTDSGIKAVSAGALKVSVERGIIRLIPKGTHIGIITNIACVGVENVKILYKVSTRELTISHAIEMMGRTTIAMIYGIGWGTIGAAIGIAALSWIPIVGPIIGGMIGGLLGNMAGSSIGSAVYSGMMSLSNGVRNMTKAVWKGLKSGTNKLKQSIFG